MTTQVEFKTLSDVLNVVQHIPTHLFNEMVRLSQATTQSQSLSLQESAPSPSFPLVTIPSTTQLEPINAQSNSINSSDEVQMTISITHPDDDNDVNEISGHKRKWDDSIPEESDIDYGNFNWKKSCGAKKRHNKQGEYVRQYYICCNSGCTCKLVETKYRMNEEKSSSLFVQQNLCHADA